MQALKHDDLDSEPGCLCACWFTLRLEKEGFDVADLLLECHAGELYTSLGLQGLCGLGSTRLGDDFGSRRGTRAWQDLEKRAP